MEFSQSTLEEIVESERSMVLAGVERYGKYWTHARGSSVFLSRCITGVSHDRMMFGRFFSLLKKHHMLALLSVVRLHAVQAAMNLRQVLEAGAAAAFAIANPEVEHFAETDAQGLLDPSQDLARKRYKWLDQHYRDKSHWIKQTKDQINVAAAHANVVSSGSVFRIADAGDAISAPFFDIEDDYVVKVDLWRVGSVALTVMDLFYGVNQGRDVLDFHADFVAHLQHAARESNTLLDELKATERFKRAAEKYGLPGTS